MSQPAPDLAAPGPGVADLRRRARLALARAASDPGCAAAVPAGAPPLQALGAASMLQISASQRPALLVPLLPEGGLMLVHGPRGVGRSHVLVGCAAALAAGDWFLGWRARRAADVLFLSGAAPAAMLGARLGSALRAMRRREVRGDVRGEAPGERLRLLAPELQQAAMPALDTAEGQARLVPLLQGAEVVVIDDAACLMPGIGSNAARSQWRFGELLRRLRHAGKTVLVGQASGEGARSRADRGALACLEAQADVVIGLRRPADYAPSDGARFELHIERANHLPGAAREVREVHLAAGEHGQVMWRAARAVDLAKARFEALITEGVPAPEAARALGLPRTTAWRWANRIAPQRAMANFPGGAVDGRRQAAGRATAADHGVPSH
jgi:hypothetical protein